MSSDTIYFIQEKDSDTACFFFHAFCLIELKEKKAPRKKGQMKLRSCCLNQQYEMGKI